MTRPTFPSLDPPQWPAKLTRGGLWLIGLGLLLTLLSGPLHRFAQMDLGVALLALGAGLLLVIIGAPITIIGFMTASARRIRIPRATAVIGMLAALLTIGALLAWLYQGSAAPHLREISTDPAAPPRFVAIKVVPAAPAARQPQRRPYPGIHPLELALPPAQALARAHRVAQRLGWKVVAVAPAAGRLEAVYTTRFFGFKDDIVVRVRPDGTGSRVDVRSRLRTNLADAGANAARVRRFLQLMQR